MAKTDQYAPPIIQIPGCSRVGDLVAFSSKVIGWHSLEKAFSNPLTTRVVKWAKYFTDGMDDYVGKLRHNVITHRRNNECVTNLIPMHR